MSLICPICGEALLLEEKRAVCPARHSFDRARQGYFNLLLDCSAHGHGDDKAMLLARRAFLEGSGQYEALRTALSDELAAVFPKGGTLLDAGCGEGYYLRGILEKLTKKGLAPCAFGFDISRDAARLAAARGTHGETYFVASAFHIPIKDASCDAVLSLFSPFAEEEYARVLKPNGLLIRAFPEGDHLMELKKAVYENVTENTAKADVARSFELLSCRELRAVMELENEALTALFDMTPYAHKTSRSDREKLAAIPSLSVRMHVGIQILRKKGATA